MAVNGLSGVGDAVILRCLGVGQTVAASLVLGEESPGSVGQGAR